MFFKSREEYDMTDTELRLRLLELMGLTAAQQAYAWITGTPLANVAATEAPAETKQPAKEEAPAKEKAPAKAEKPKGVDKPRTEKPAPKAEASEVETPKALDYKADVVPAIIATVARIDGAGQVGDGKAQVRVLLESYGVDHGTKLPADKLADFVDRLKAL
jgi:hypothetical protein